MFCERCGAKLENGMMYCQNCGAPVKSQNSGKPYGDLDKTVAYHEEEEKTVAYHEQDEDKTVAYYETAYQQPRYGKESRSREDFTEQNYDSQNHIERAIAGNRAILAAIHRKKITSPGFMWF